MFVTRYKKMERDFGCKEMGGRASAFETAFERPNRAICGAVNSVRNIVTARTFAMYPFENCAKQLLVRNFRLVVAMSFYVSNKNRF